MSTSTRISIFAALMMTVALLLGSAGPASAALAQEHALPVAQIRTSASGILRAPTDKTMYACEYPGTTVYERDYHRCPNSHVRMIQEGRTIAKFNVDSNGKMYTGSKPFVGCLVAVASGGLAFILPAPVGVAFWVAAGQVASKVLAVLGVGYSCR